MDRLIDRSNVEWVVWRVDGWIMGIWMYGSIDPSIHPWEGGWVNGRMDGRKDGRHSVKYMKYGCCLLHESANRSYDFAQHSSTISRRTTKLLSRYFLQLTVYGG